MEVVATPNPLPPVMVRGYTCLAGGGMGVGPSKKKLKPIVGNQSWVRVVSCARVDIEESGFRCHEPEQSFVQWDAIIRIATGYEIHPIAIVDMDFWAFQTKDNSVTYTRSLRRRVFDGRLSN